MKTKLNKMQLKHLLKICKKGWNSYNKPNDELDEMEKNGLLTKEVRLWGGFIYYPTDKGYLFLLS